MKVIFMGTPDFAVGTLEALVKAGHEVVLAVTQPDKPKGRGKAMQPTPVKEAAQRHQIPVYQPVKIRELQCVEYLRTIPADVIVVVAFGQILPKKILELPHFGCINVHASLLPMYRGAAPIQWAVIDGRKETGVTTMRMDEGLDTGDMILRKVVPIADDETGGSLFDKLSAVGAELLVETLEKLENGTAVLQPQDSSVSSYAKMIRKSMGKIDWGMEAGRIECLIRGLNPWPSAYTSLSGKTLKIWRAHVTRQAADGHVPGEVTDSSGNLCVACKDWILALDEVQLEGKKRMSSDAFLRGFTVLPGTVLE